MVNKKKDNKKVFFIIVVTLIVCTYLINNIIDVLRYRGGKPEEIIYKSKAKSAITYNVYLKPNDFIDAPFLTDDYSFVSSLVEYIKTSFSYDYLGTSGVPIDYDYYIKATIVSKYVTDQTNANKPLWNKDFILLDHKSVHASDSKIKIVENLNIGLDYYNNLLETFRKGLNITLDSRLDIALIVSIKGPTINNVPIIKDHRITMSIPLGVSAFDINVISNFPEDEILYNKEQRTIESSYMLAIVYIVLLIVIIAVAIYFIRNLLRREENEYEAKVNKILSEYDDRIVTVSSFVRYETLGIIDISDFGELLTLSDETLEPIIFWEKKNQKRKEAWFVIVRDKLLYRYVIVCNKQ